jgi:putative flippase GtrA
VPHPVDGRAVAAPRRVAAEPARAPSARRPPAGPLRRFVRFCLVGAVGTVVNTVVFAALSEVGLPVLAAAFLSLQAATAVNFAGSELTVFRSRRRGPRRVRALLFFAMATAGFLVTGPLLILLVSASAPPVLANVLAIGALTAVRFAVADRIIWSAGPGSLGRRASRRLPKGAEALTGGKQ